MPEAHALQVATVGDAGRKVVSGALFEARLALVERVLRLSPAARHLQGGEGRDARGGGGARGQKGEGDRIGSCQAP